VKEFLPLVIAAVVASVVFALMWRNGYFLKLTGYVQETRDELRKCSWPSKNELFESTTVVIVVIALLGGFIMGTDFVIAMFVRLIT
jgi:preprotein translocase subunit SecE